MPADSVSYQYLPGYRSQLRTPPKWSCLSQLVHKVGIVFPYRHWHGRQEWKVVIIIHYPLGGGVSYKHNALASTSRHTVPLKVWTEPPFDCYSTLIFQKSVQFPHIKYCTFVLFLFYTAYINFATVTEVNRRKQEYVMADQIMGASILKADATSKEQVWLRDWGTPLIWQRLKSKTEK